MRILRPYKETPVFQRWRLIDNDRQALFKNWWKIFPSRVGDGIVWRAAAWSPASLELVGEANWKLGHTLAIGLPKQAQLTTSWLPGTEGRRNFVLTVSGSSFQPKPCLCRLNVFRLELVAGLFSWCHDGVLQALVFRPSSDCVKSLIDECFRLQMKTWANVTCAQTFWCSLDNKMTWKHNKTVWNVQDSLNIIIDEQITKANFVRNS